MSALSELFRDPFDDAIARRIDRLFTPQWNSGATLLVGSADDTDSQSEQRQAAPGSVSTWGNDRSWQSFFRAPRLDLSVQEASYVVRVDLPGVKKEDLDISADDNNLLTVAGSREERNEETKEDFYRKERTFGRFQRRIRLPADADADAAKAQLEEGVLTLTIPKRAEEEQQRKKIRIE
jgi:HSP20 family molecular chaperone IbpA